MNKFLYRRGGAEAYMYEVAARQRRAGHEVAHFGMQHPDNAPAPHSDAFPRLVEFDGESVAPLEGVRALGRMVWSTSARRGMAEVVRRFRPDVVHLHNIYHGLSPSVLGPASESGAGLVMTLHDYKLACPTYHFLDHGRVCTACVQGGFRQAVRRRCKDGSVARSAAGALELRLHTWAGAYDPVDVFVCPSRFLADRMVEADVYPSRMRVLDNFVDVDAVDAGKGEGATEPPIVFVGRLSQEKGVDVLVRAVAAVPDLRLVVAGEGREEAQLRALAERVAPGRVVFVGRQDRDGVLGLLRQAMVAVVPSRWYENQPMAVIEAFAVGTPVVASRLGGLPELVVEGETGWLVPADDVQALAATLRRVTSDPGECRRRGAVARSVAQGRFSPTQHMAGLDAIYEEAREATR